MENPWKLFHLIQNTGMKSLSLSETNCEADGSPNHNRWVVPIENC